MRYIHWRDDFSITESFSTGQASAPVPQRVRIEYFTAKGHGRFVAERNGNTFVNCELSADGNSLVVHVSLRDRPIGHGRLLRIATVITEDANFPGGLKYSSIPDKVAAVLYFGKSDGPLDIASEIVFDGVDRLSLLEDVKLSGPDIGDLLSWNGADWVNIPRSAVAPDLSDYVRWTELPDYVTVSDLQDILADLITSDEITSLSQRITALEQVQFFELATDPVDSTKFYVKLKDEYTGLAALGWMAAGGVNGSGSGGGSGLVETVSRWTDLQNMSTAPEDGTSAVFNSRAVYEVYQAVKALQRSTPNVSLSNGEAYSTLSVNGQSAQLYSKAQVDSLLANIDLSGYVTKQNLTTALSSYVTANDLTTAIGNINHLSSVTTNQDGTLDFNWKNGDTTRADLSHRHLDYENSINTITANYVPKNRKINGHTLDSDVKLSATEDLGVATWAMDDGSSGTTVPFDRLPNLYIGGTMVAKSPALATLLGVAAISNSLSSTGSEQSLIVWEPNAGGTGVGAWHLLGNLYADGWISSGGIGNDSGGGGIDLDRVWQSLTNNTDKPGVEINIAHIPNLTAEKIPSITTSKISDINTWVTGKGVSIAGLSVNIGGSITAAALKQALGISGDETPTISSVVLTNGESYSEITVDDTSASFYTKAQIETVLSNYATQSWVQQQSPANYVTLDTAQTVPGAKTFSGGITMSGANILPSADSANSLGSNDYRFNAAFIRNIYTSFFQFRDGTTKEETGNIAFGDGYLQLSIAGTNAVNYMFYSGSGFFKQGGGVPLGRSDHRWSSVYSVDADLSGDLALSSTSHIDIGPLRIEYDATNKALHITRKDSTNDTNTYGLYADGSIAAGGVQQTS